MRFLEYNLLILLMFIASCHGDPKYISKTKRPRPKTSVKKKIPQSVKGILQASVHSRMAVRPYDLDRALRRRHWVPVFYFSGERVVRNVMYLNMAKPDPKGLKCSTDWRAYLWNGPSVTVVDFQLECARMRTGNRSYVLEGDALQAAKTLVTTARLTARHRLVKVAVPVVHDPDRVRSMIARYAVAVLPDHDDSLRYPWFEVSTWGASPLPADLSAIDAAVARLRSRLKSRLETFVSVLRRKYAARIHLVGQPYPIRERFRRELSAVWGIRVLCALGTDYDTMVMMASFPRLQLEKVNISTSYPIYAILDGKSGTIAAFSASLSALELDPPLELE